MPVLEKISWWLVFIGALNWLLIGLININVVGLLLGGSDSLYSRIVYVLVGIAGVYLLPQAFGVRMLGRRKES